MFNNKFPGLVNRAGGTINTHEMNVNMLPINAGMTESKMQYKGQMGGQPKVPPQFMMSRQNNGKLLVVGPAIANK